MGNQVRNAPVFFTFAQIRHNTVAMITEPIFAKHIQEKMRNIGYSDFQSQPMVIFELPEVNEGLAQPKIRNIERHVFSNLKKTKSFIVEPNSLSFQTTDYVNSEVFVKDFGAGLEIVNEVVGLDFYDRLGIRYLDAVCPPNGEEGLGVFLRQGVLGLVKNLGEAPVFYSATETRLLHNGFNVLTRAIIKGGKINFPNDLQPIGVEIKDKFKHIDQVHAIVDTDAFQETREAFNLESILKAVDLLHESASIVFKATVTDEAWEFWDQADQEN